MKLEGEISIFGGFFYTVTNIVDSATPDWLV